MSNHNTTEHGDSTMMQPRKPERKSVQFGRVSYSDDSNDKELSVHEQMGNPCKFMERSAMCSTKHIPPPSPPQRKASAEVILDEHDDGSTPTMGLSLISMNSLLDSLVTNEDHHAEEQNEQEDESYHSHDSSRYNSPLFSSRKTASPAAPSRTTRPRLGSLSGLSPSQRPPCFPTRCL